MECPKCHKIIADNLTACPHCHKVLSLVCPNCHTIGQNPVCQNCGYIILEKCSKCGKTVSTSVQNCKCGFPTKTSVAYKECESDEFASISVTVASLKAIRRHLASAELFAKFKTKLKNMLSTQFRNIEGNIITYGDTYVINMNKELSFPTSADKAVRIALKLVNACSELNLKLQEELGTPLKLTIKIIKKNAEELLENKTYQTNVKPLTISKNEKKYLKGSQIIIDEFVQDAIGKDYKTDSLYTVEENGLSVVFYEIKLDNYILPPDKEEDIPVEELPAAVENNVSEKKEEEGLYDFKIFNINAKCNFEKTSNILSKLGTNKILAIRADKTLQPRTSEIVDFYKKQDKRVIRIFCSEETAYRPWSLMCEIYRQYFGLSFHNSFISKDFKPKAFPELAKLIFNNVRQSSTPEDARFAYMDDFVRFLSVLKDVVIIIEGFEYIDDTSLQTIELYFDNYKKINNNFIFVTDENTAVHSKIKTLLRTPVYTEIRPERNKMEDFVSEIKEDASDFITSFYYEKIKSNFGGSKIYFDTAIEYLKEKDVLISFEGRLLVKNNDSVFIPAEIEDLIRTRLKLMSKNTDASMILAYLALINPRMDYELLEKLEVKDVQKNVNYLVNTGFVYKENNFVYLNNPDLFKPVILSGMKKNVIEFLAKNILAKIGKGLDSTTTLLLMGKLALYKDEYLLLWKNSEFAISAGDYDAYLKNSFGFMTLLEYIKGNISEEDIEEHKKQVYHNILMSLYAYSPEKIYDIEQILLNDAIEKEDKENTVKLSNLMLQGALISGKYGDALGLLNNILRNMPNPKLIVDGVINTKFLLLSLVNIEILFNVGDFKTCIDISNELLSVLSPEILEKIKPASFSMNLFVGHLTDTLRLGAIGYILSLDDGLDTYLDKIKIALVEDLPDRDTLICVKNFLSGEDVSLKDVENLTPFSKILYLIIEEFSEENINYADFAQNIYQAKLLASDVSQPFLETLCELFISYAYQKAGVYKKAESIYKDIREKAENSSNINIMLLARYFMSALKIEKGEVEGGMLIINDTLAFIRDNAEQEILVSALLKKLLIDTAEKENLSFIDLETENRRLLQLAPDGKLKRFGIG